MKKLVLVFLLLSSIAFAQPTQGLSKTAQPGSLYFPIGQPSNVAHDKVFTVGHHYGAFLWQIVAKPKTANALAYELSDGAGGTHAILIGYQSDATRYSITGNFFSGSEVVSFNTPVVGRLNEWGRVAVEWDLSTIRIWMKGVMVFSAPYSGDRYTVPGGSDSNLYVGGSFHLNCGCNIARVLGIEGEAPFFHDFASPLIFNRRVYHDFTTSTWTNASFLADYSSPSEYFPDHGDGINGERHDGILTAYTRDTPYPTFQQDPARYQPVGIFTPALIPSNALVFDSFNRPDQTVEDQDSPTLGFTESGSLGPLKWQAPFGWGILAERAFAYYNQYYSNWVETNTPNVDVRVTGENTGLLIRRTDEQNKLRVVKNSTSVTTELMVNGSPIYTSFPASGSTLRAVANGNLVTIYVDGSQIETLDVSSLPLSNNDGLTYAGDISFYDNFTIFPVN